jgi:hypothetical protein
MLNTVLYAINLGDFYYENPAGAYADKGGRK